MSAKPWEKWTAEMLKTQADYMAECNHCTAVAALEAFAALKEAEQRGERCVLPVELLGSRLDVYKCISGCWVAIGGSPSKCGKGETMQAAIEDLARKIKEAK